MAARTSSQARPGHMARQRSFAAASGPRRQIVTGRSEQHFEELGPLRPLGLCRTLEQLVRGKAGGG